MIRTKICCQGHSVDFFSIQEDASHGSFQQKCDLSQGIVRVRRRSLKKRVSYQVNANRRGCSLRNRSLKEKAMENFGSWRPKTEKLNNGEFYRIKAESYVNREKLSNYRVDTRLHSLLHCGLA